jgi:multiple sugar transport system substrate-binding protein
MAVNVPSIKKKMYTGVFCVFVFVVLAYAWRLTGGSGKNLPDPVVLTLWHNPGSQARHALSDIADEFNRTVGRKKGIILAVTSIGKSLVLHEKLELIANGDPGAPEPPNIAVAYPKTAVLLARKNRLVDIGSYFSERELSACVPRFLEEGRIMDGKLYVFPTNKSTEILIVNRTLFDRFASDTGTKLEDLGTVEGLLRSARGYYEWTDAQTPDIPDDGRAFFMIDNPFNFIQVAYRQLGENFLSDKGMNFSSPVFEKVWDAAYTAAIKGHAAIYNGFGTDLTKTGDLVCWTSSSAGITFLPVSMTYADNTSEPVAFDVLPYPVFEGGKKTAIQRGGGFCLLRSGQRKEDAAIVFLKWLTEPEHNIHYLEDSGYLPVTREALAKIVIDRPMEISPVRNRFLDVVSVMNEEYDFYIPHLTENYGILEKRYESLLRKNVTAAREKLRNLRDSPGGDAAIFTVSEGVREKFIDEMED